MVFPTSLIDILLAVLLGVFAIVGIYLVIILVRVNSLLARIDKIVSYTDRIGAVLQSFEAIPMALVSVIRQIALAFLDRGTSKSKKKKPSSDEE